jgi:hypothetical protein
MRKILPVSLMLAALNYNAMAQAQAPMPSGAAAENQAQLEERFGQCLKNPSCTTQARLQIIQEENDRMNEHFQKIHQACADSDFQDCIGSKKSDVDAWYKAQDNMQKMMASLEAQSMSGKEPAAGDVPSPLPKINK